MSRRIKLLLPLILLVLAALACGDAPIPTQTPLPPALTQPVAARFAPRRKTWTRRPPYAFPLTGLVHCVCGQRFEGFTHRERRVYRHPLPCEQKHPYQRDAVALESAVRERVAGLAPPRAVAALTEEAVARALARASRRDESAERARLGAAIDRLAELYAEGEITREKYAELKAGYAAELADLAAPAPPLPLDAAAALVRGLSPFEVQGAAFGNLVRAYYSRLVVAADGSLRYEARDWCADWA